MTWDEFIVSQEAVMKNISSDGDIFGRAVSTVHSEVGKRIFKDGLAANGEKIGNYSTRGPLRISPPNKAPGIYKSYKDYRDKIGLQTSFVDLKLTGLLQTDFLNGLRKVNASHWQAQPKNAANVKKAEDNTEHFKKEIFALTPKEIDRLAEVFEFELEKVL